MEETLLVEVNKRLDDAVKAHVILEYKLTRVYSPTETFKKNFKTFVRDGATLYPKLTYKIEYWGGGLIDDYQYCEAMAYYAIKDGKLLGCGVIVSKPVTRAWSKIWAFGEYAIYF